MKNITKKTFISFLLSLLILTPLGTYQAVLASDQELVGVANVNGSTLRLRPEPNTKKDYILLIPDGASFIIEDQNAGPSDKDCPDKWYRIRYEGTVGYVCGSFVIVSTPGLRGFPESYQEHLIKLQDKYPNWNFVADYTGVNNTALSWNYVIQGQNSFPKNLIQTSNAGWKHLDTYNYKTDQFLNNFSGGGTSWYAPNDEVIKYYVDPRNFLNEERIFMFAVLNYDPKYHLLEVVQDMLKGTFMEGKPNITKEDRDRNMSYAEIFMEAARINDINPYGLVSTVIQEVSRNRSDIVKGTYLGFDWGSSGEYEGYFNFYNIGATGSDKASEIIRNGIQRAKREGWNSEYKAILGGASGTLKSYHERGQATKYYYKFDVINSPGSGYFVHQYMQNVQDPYSQSINLYRIYRDSGTLNTAITFKIPVYSNMPDKTELPHPGNPNNYIKNLMVNGKAVNGFNSEKLEYTYLVPKNTKYVDLSASVYVPSSTKLSGVGKIELKSDSHYHEIVVTAGNTTTRIYKINFVKTENVDITIEDIIEQTEFRYQDNHLSKLPRKMKASELINEYKKLYSDANVVIKDSNNRTKNNEILGTGDIVSISVGNEAREYRIVVYGDINGDGEISIVDLLRIQKILIDRNYNLSSIYKEAADVNRDGKITIHDLLRTQKYLLGDATIDI